MFGVPEVLGHLTLQRSFQHCLGELFQKTVDILGRPPALLQHLIDQLVADRRLLLLPLHSVLLFLPENAYTVFRTPSCYVGFVLQKSCLGFEKVLDIDARVSQR